VIFVDTSVWVAYLRGGDAALDGHLEGLLDGERAALAAPVRVELLSGAPGRESGRLRRLLSALPVYYPVEGTWARMERWVEAAVAKGQRFGMGDLLIGAIAADQEGQVWSLDGDFARLEALGFVRSHGTDVL
jgi:predicted nucleic acid-binding protein